MARYSAYLFLLNGAYLGLTGLWALIDLQSFIMVTGPKSDIWLVKSLSLMFICIGIAFLLAYYFLENSLPMIILGFSVALALLGIDLYYSMNEIIPKVYLIDGFIQLLFLMGWIMILRRRKMLRKNDLV